MKTASLLNIDLQENVPLYREKLIRHIRHEVKDKDLSWLGDHYVIIKLKGRFQCVNKYELDPEDYCKDLVYYINKSVSKVGAFSVYSHLSQYFSKDYSLFQILFDDHFTSAQNVSVEHLKRLLFTSKRRKEFISTDPKKNKVRINYSFDQYSSNQIITFFFFLDNLHQIVNDHKLMLDGLNKNKLTTSITQLEDFKHGVKESFLQKAKAKHEAESHFQDIMQRMNKRIILEPKPSFFNRNLKDKWLKYIDNRQVARNVDLHKFGSQIKVVNLQKRDRVVVLYPKNVKNCKKPNKSNSFSQNTL